MASMNTHSNRSTAKQQFCTGYHSYKKSNGARTFVAARFIHSVHGGRATDRRVLSVMALEKENIFEKRELYIHLNIRGPVVKLERTPRGKNAAHITSVVCGGPRKQLIDHGVRENVALDTDARLQIFKSTLMRDLCSRQSRRWSERRHQQHEEAPSTQTSVVVVVVVVVVVAAAARAAALSLLAV